jgi:hypothetical protein
VKTVLNILCFDFLFFITSNKRHNKRILPNGD